MRRFTLVILALPFFIGCATKDATPDLDMAYIGSCLNPGNGPENSELNGQHDDLRAYLKGHGIRFLSFGSIGVSIVVRADKAQRAEALIKQALAENPSRWTMIMFDFQRPEKGLPRVESVDRPS